MPPITAAHLTMALRAMLTVFALGATVMTGITVSSFSNYENYGPTGTPFHSLGSPLAARLSPGLDLESCPTCTFFQPVDGQDYHGIQHSLNIKPTPTLPLKISYAVPYIQHAKPRPTPQTTRKAELPPIPTNTAPASSSLLKLIPLIIWSFLFTDTVAYLLHRINSIRNRLQLFFTLKQMLKKIKTTILLSSYNPKNFLSVFIALVRDCFNGEEKPFYKARRGLKRALAKEKSRSNRKAIQRFKRQRDILAHRLNMCYERPVSAPANIELRFGPSIENAEADFWDRLDNVEMTEDKRADVLAFFRKALHSFTYALAVEESKPEGSNSRYLSVIHDQDRLIDSLRLLHEHREQAFADSEDLVWRLCRWNKENSPQEQMPWDKYSAEYDKFIISPTDSPAALSMKVSVSSVPFHRRPVTILDSDPHWQSFLESTTGRRPGQEARVVFSKEGLKRDDVEERENIKEGDVSETRDTPRRKDGKYHNETRMGGNVGIKAASEQSHHDVPTREDDPFSNDEEVEEDRGTKDTGAETANGPLKGLEDALIWFKRKLDSMKGGHGTSERPDPDPTIELTAEIAEARLYQEEEWARWPKSLAVDDCETQIATLEVDIACMKRDLGIPTTAGDITVSQRPAQPKSTQKS